MDMAPILPPATLAEFRQSWARIEEQEARLRQIRRMGSMLMFEEALADHPFIHSLRFTRVELLHGPADLHPTFAIPGERCADAHGVVDAMRYPGQASESFQRLAAKMAQAGVTEQMAIGAMDALSEAAELLYSTMGEDEHRNLMRRSPMATARDAASIAMEIGLPELAAAIDRAKIAQASPVAGQTAQPRSL